jgi:hypothetical protein
MSVKALEVTQRSPFAEGMTFGAVGQYELLRTRITMALDPSIPVNRAIVDLDNAHTSVLGLVEVESDALVLRPKETSRGNRCLLSVVPNRGTTGGLPFRYDEPPRFGPETGLQPGDGWVLRAGWTIVWTGWQWDIPRTEGRLGCSVPEVVDLEDQSLEGTIRVELQPFLQSAPSLPLRSASDISGTTTCYPAVDLEQADAVLQVASHRGSPFVPVARSAWRFAHADGDGSPVLDRESIWLDGGFHPDLVYEVRYRTNRCPLVGAGLAAVRDVASHMLSDDDLDFGFAVGWSQSGRFLRQFLSDGFNCDEQGSRVFDAVLPFFAGASTGEFNQRFGQPSEAQAEGSSLRPPFAINDLLVVDNLRGTAPKFVTVDTASEYWRGDGSLAHIDGQGCDVPLDDVDTRAYYLAGTEHFGGVPLGPRSAAPLRNYLGVSPINRAVLEATRKWVVEGDAPPLSRLPRRSDGTAVPRHETIQHWTAITGIAAPKEADMPHPAQAEWASGPLGPVYVSALDGDGNEVAGLRHPELSVPLATHTGWNLVLARGARWASVSSVTGNSHPFPAHVSSIQSRDQRRSISERYLDIDDYLNRIKLASDELVREGFLLPEDVERVIATGRAHFEILASTEKGL